MLYHKGVSEDIVSNYNYHEKADRDELEKFKQYYFAIYDKEFNLLQSDIPLPLGMFFTKVMTEEGELLGKKNQDYFGTEEDQVIYYKLKLKEIAKWWVCFID